MERTDYDTVFGCPICLGPKQSMIFGLCQHFVCAECLYDPVQLSLKKAFQACPICKAKNVFPQERPDIPDSTKQLMEIVGVVKCSRKRCGEEMWSWDREQHDSTCRGVTRRTQARRDVSPGRPSCSRKADTRQMAKRRRSSNRGKVN
uniref:Putative interleukin 1 signal transducer strongylocentrotus purpuratus n=1 Tax=Amblyomma parvum TaxID=251391 RepID=A0A023FVM4_AMBPA